MFVLKTLGKLILGNTEQSDLLQLSSGQLWHVKIDGATVVRTRIFEDASATLKRENEPFHYALELRDATDASVSSSKHPSSSLRFDITEAMQLQKTLSEGGRTCFVWLASSLIMDPRTAKKPSAPTESYYEYVVDGETSPTTLEMFHVAMAQCMFERREARSHESASDAQLQALMVSAPGTAISSLKLAKNKDQGPQVYTSEAAQFYVFDAATNVFMPRGQNVIARLFRSSAAAFDFIIEIIDSSNDTILHQQKLDPDTTQHTDRQSNSFIWCYCSENGYIWTFSLRFADSVALMAYSNTIGQCVYECLNREKFAKLAKEDAQYLMNPFLQDVEMTDVQDSDKDASETESPEESGVESEEDQDDRDKQSTSRLPRTGERNSQLVVGYKNDRSFVSHGHSIGVFKHTDDQRLEFQTDINDIKTLSGKCFSPKKMMLHEEDSRLILMNPDDQHTLYNMDLEYGKIVDEWQVHKDANVTSIIPDHKYAQMTPGKTLIGLNANSIFRIDPRLSGAKRVDSEMKSYVVKNQFSCGATTGAGELAVASEKGDIRLFNKLDKRAKTLLPGFGDPIIGIDVTESGKYLVATCKTYLLLISTELPGTDVLGFARSMGAEKPAPRRLQLKPEHVAFMGTAISFTPARFSTGQSEERSIITSTGPYVITWNLRRLKQGKLYDYQIKKYNENVVADNFRFGQDRSIVVTLPHHVTMMSGKSLSVPSPKAFRGQLNSPSSGRRAPNPGDVVDSPY